MSIPYYNYCIHNHLHHDHHRRQLFRSNFSIYIFLYLSLRCVQSDQIWRNLATLAKCYNYLAIFEVKFGIWQSFEPTLVECLWK